MNKKILENLKRPYVLLIWALICGLAYLSVISQFVLRFTNTAEGAGILLWVFIPAIVCGAALLIIKAVKGAYLEGRTRLILSVFYAHLFIIAMGILIFIGMFV